MSALDILFILVYHQERKTFPLVVRCILISEILSVKNVDPRTDKLLHLKESHFHQTLSTGQRTSSGDLTWASHVVGITIEESGKGLGRASVHMCEMHLCYHVCSSHLHFRCLPTNQALFFSPFSFCLMLELEEMPLVSCLLLMWRDLGREVRATFYRMSFTS